MRMVEIEGDDLIWPRLVGVIREMNFRNRGYKGALTCQTRLVEDLRLIVDPAGDLLGESVEKFNVDFTSCPFNRYFLTEGIYFISYPFRRSPKKYVS